MMADDLDLPRCITKESFVSRVVSLRPVHPILDESRHDPFNRFIYLFSEFFSLLGPVSFN